MVDADVFNVMFKAAWDLVLAVKIVYGMQSRRILLKGPLRVDVGHHFGVAIRKVGGGEQVRLRDQPMWALMVERGAIVRACNLRTGHARVPVVQQLRK